jgi:hypothetical protein
MVANGSGDFDATTILLKRTPFSGEEVERFWTAVANAPRNAGWYAPGKPLREGVITRLITLPSKELAAEFRSYKYDITPVFDDSPFFWHFARFRDVLRGQRDTKRLDIEDGFGERIILFLFGLGIVYAAAFLMLPFFVIRKIWLELPHKALTAVYFAAIGMGFMFYEVVLIQKLTLLLGYPTYSLSVTLAAVLAFTGIGSFLSTRYAANYRAALGVLIGVILAVTLFYQFGMDSIVEASLPHALAVRVGLAVLMLLPLGLCLGGFMPIGLAVAAAHTVHREQYVAWGWAVNGFFSVISSILATILSMTLGFTMVMNIALALYLIAAAALLAIPRARLG